MITTAQTQHISAPVDAQKAGRLRGEIKKQAARVAELQTGLSDKRKALAEAKAERDRLAAAVATQNTIITRLTNEYSNACDAHGSAQGVLSSLSGQLQQVAGTNLG